MRLFLLLLFLFSCTQKIEKNIFTKSAPVREESTVVKFGILATSNLKGKYQPHFQFIPVKNEKLQQLEIGGLSLLAGYFQAAKQAYKNNIIKLDTGDFLPEEHRKEDFEKLIKAYDYLSYDGVSLTQDELLYFLKEENKTNIPFINSNIIDLKTGDALSRDNVLPYKIIEKNGIKIGLISITSFKTIDNSISKKFVGLYFQDPVASIIKMKNKLRKEGAKAIILLAHVQSSCIGQNPKKTKTAKNKKDNQIDCPNDEDQLLTIVKRIPPNSVDLIVSSEKNFINGFLGHVPVLQSPGNGKFISYAELKFDANTKELLKNETTLFAPIKLCHEFFVKTEDCFYPPQSNDKTDRHEIIQSSFFEKKKALFLGNIISVDNNLKSILETN